MNGKNVLIVSCVFPPEPVVSGILSYDIAIELALKNNVTVISPLPTRPYGSSYRNHITRNQPFTHKILTSYTSPRANLITRLMESLSFGRALSKFLYSNKNDIDIIYANAWPIFAQFFLVKTAMRLNIPVVLTVQDIYPESLIAKLPKIIGKLVRFLFLPIDRFILNNVQKVITISPPMKDYLVSTRDLNKSNVEVIRNWQNDELFTNQNQQKINRSDKFIFMYLGSIVPSAGVDLLIESFASANIDNSKLIIAGDGSDKNKCIKISKKYSCDIQFVKAKLEDVPKIQAKADVLLLPLKKGIGKTASPSKLASYMFSKKPVIASVDMDSDPAKIIKEAKSGWVIEPENIDMLIDVMREASLNKKSELELKGENGFNYAVLNLSKKNNLKKLVKAILE